MQANAAERQEVARWLAGLFLSELNEDAISLYRSAAGQSFLDRMDRFSPLMALVGVLRDLERQEVPLRTLRLDLAAAYGGLFLTGGPRSVPLFASAYLSEKGLLQQEPARESEKVLERLGMSVPPDFREPADHVGIQLNILAELAGRGDLEDLDEAGYLRGAMLPWIPTLSALCARLSPVPLYRELGPATLGWLRALDSELPRAKRAG